LLGSVEEFVRPVDRGAQRLVTFDGAPPAPRQQLESVIEPLGDRRRSEDLHPRRREFYSQRDPIEATTDLYDGVMRILIRRKTRAGESRALNEQLDCSAVTVGFGDRKAPDWHDPLAGDSQSLTAGGEDSDAGAPL